MKVLRGRTVFLCYVGLGVTVKEYDASYCYRGYEQERRVAQELLAFAPFWSSGKSTQPKARPAMHRQYVRTHLLFLLFGYHLFPRVCYELILNSILVLITLQCWFSFVWCAKRLTICTVFFFLNVLQVYIKSHFHMKKYLPNTEDTRSQVSVNQVSTPKSSSLQSLRAASGPVVDIWS